MKRAAGRVAGLLALAALAAGGCGGDDGGKSGHARMVAELAELAKRTDDEHDWIGDREARELRARLAALPPGTPPEEAWLMRLRLAVCEGWLGDFDAATRLIAETHAAFPSLETRLPKDTVHDFFLAAGLTWLRLGEVRNCCARRSPESCILPLKGKAIHVEQEGSRNALRFFTELADRFPDRLTPRWMLNLAAMTLGEHPDAVPERHRISPKVFESEEPFPRFPNVASEIGLDFMSLAGSVVVDDFDGDGRLDAVVSSWDPRAQLRFFRNRGDGTFEDRTAPSGLTGILGGANLVQADFDNDGDLDVLVLRGTWLGPRGRHPKSLLRNDGRGTFVDVTFAAGLGESRLPTETAAWADYDGDGDLDLYVGHEHGEGIEAPSALFRNEGNGTFADATAKAGVANLRYAKGVSWGDVDNDGWPDLYVANLRREGNRLYRNNRDGTFTDVAAERAVFRPLSSYACWFWDYDNDGNEDLYVASYQGGIETVAASYLGKPIPEGTEFPCLYRGDGKGGFQELAGPARLRKPLMAMGANFGDLDNDGWLDFYLGTGYPEYEALMPKVMYRNRGGRDFADVTFAGGFGHLQKGHGVAFADFDEDGDQDVFEQMGGAFRGDGAYFALYRNPGFGNRWLKLKLVGTKANRGAIGARVRLDFVDGGALRSVHRTVGSGGSFGANPLRQEIGLGKASVIDLLEITWPGSGRKQTFRKLAVDRFLEITEGRDEPRVLSGGPP